MPLSAATRTRPNGQFARPCLEALEDRDVLSGPAYLTLAIDYSYGRDILVHGVLSNTANPGNQLININGTVNGQVSTDSDGRYALAAQPNTLGQVWAQKADGGSNIAMGHLYDVAPTITALDAIEGSGGVWTIQGTVTYHRPFQSMTVRLDGVPVSINLTEVTAGSTGQFSWSVQLNGTSTDNGSVWAEAVSPWGLVSQKRYDDIYQTGT